MRHRLIALLTIIGSAAVLDGQSARPADIHPVSLSRVPPVQRADLDDDGKRIYDVLTGTGKTLAPTGPSAVTMHSPKAAEPIYALNQYLRKTVAGARYFEVAALVAAGEFEQQYEWSGHEPAALRAGVEQSVIDVIKFNRDVKGVPEKDATIIQLGRAIFRNHKVTPELWARMEQHFGRQGAVELTTVMADYAMVGFVLTAVDQQLPPDRKPLLPQLAAQGGVTGRWAAGGNSVFVLRQAGTSVTGEIQGLPGEPVYRIVDGTVRGNQITFFVLHDDANDPEVKAHGGNPFHNTATGTFTADQISISGSRENTTIREYRLVLKRIKEQ